MLRKNDRPELKKDKSFYILLFYKLYPLETEGKKNSTIQKVDDDYTLLIKIKLYLRPNTSETIFRTLLG